MSLKAFHIVFIVVSLLFCLGFGAWGVMNYTDTHSLTNLALGIVAFAGVPALGWYGVWFLKKMKRAGLM